MEESANHNNETCTDSVGEKTDYCLSNATVEFQDKTISDSTALELENYQIQSSDKHLDPLNGDGNQDTVSNTSMEDEPFVHEITDKVSEHNNFHKLSSNNIEDVKANKHDTNIESMQQINKTPNKISTAIDVDELAKLQQETEDLPEVKGFIVALLDLAFDKQEDVAAAALSTLQSIGHRHPATILRTLHAYLAAKGKSSVQLRSSILTIMESTINPAIELGQLNISLAVMLMKFALEEMISSSGSLPEVQVPTCNILVSIGTVYCKDVMELLLGHFQPNVIPHQYIIQSLSLLATQNIYGTVPLLKSVLDTLVTLLPLVKGKVKLAFASALAKFSEALLFYLANIDRAPDPYIKREWFEDEFSQAFNVLSMNWLPCKDPKTCHAILEALGFMSQLLSESKLAEVETKWLPNLINTYKSSAEPLYVSRCLALFLEALQVMPKEPSDPHLQEILLNALFQQVCITPDYSQPTTVKNHYEVLRCFEILARSSLQKVLNFLLAKLENTTEKYRVASLTVLKHLLNSLKEQLSSHIGAIQLHLRPLLTDNQNRVRKALAQVVVAMAVQGYLTFSNGTGEFVAFLLKLCALPNHPEGTGSPNTLDSILHPLQRTNLQSTSVSNEELRQMAENVIHLLATTDLAMERVLWPHLLEYAVNKEYNRAIGIIAKTLSHLVTRRQPENETTSSETGKLPTTGAIAARFLVLASSLSPSERSLWALQFLQHFAAFINPSLIKIWDKEIPTLINNLKYPYGSKAVHDRTNWHQAVQNLVDVTFSEMKNISVEWIQQFTSALFDQVVLYENEPTERGFLLTLIGLAIHHAQVIQGPSYGVDFIMMVVRHQFVEESLGCATAIGICARSFFDVVLLKLHNVERNDYGRKSSGFLGFMKEGKSETESDLLKATAVRCYGKIAMEAPSMELLTKVDKYIIRKVLNVLQTSKDLTVRTEGLNAIAHIARALFPDRLHERYLLPGRAELLKESLVQLKSVPTPEDLSRYGSVGEVEQILTWANFCMKALEAISALVLLPPSLGPEDQSILLDTALEHGLVFHSKILRISMNEQSAEDFCVNAVETAENLLRAMEHLALNLLREAIHPATIDIVFSKLLPWTKGKHSAMRRAALGILKLTLENYIDLMKFEPGVPTRFSEGHNMLAKLLPRCVDPKLSVRDLGLDCLGLVFRIMAKYLGYSEDYEDSTIATLEDLKTSLGLQNFAESISSLATMLSQRTAANDLWSLLESMVTELVDPFPTSTSGVSLVICFLLKTRGQEIHLRIKELLDLLLTRLKLVECPETRCSILNAINILAAQQLDAVATTLLNHSLPHDEDVSDCWKTLASDASLGVRALEYLLEIIMNAVPYEEKGHNNESIASFRLLSAISALNSMCQVSDICTALQANFAQLFSVLLLALGCFLGASPPIRFPANNDKFSFVPNREAYRLNPYQIVADTIRTFLLSVHLDALAEAVVQYRQLENTGDIATFCNLIATVAALTTVHAPAQFPRCVSYFSTALKSIYERHRVVSVAFFAELIQQKCGGRDGEMLESIITGLISALADSSSAVRRFALQGLGGLGTCDNRYIKSLSPAVINSLIDGLEEDGHDKQESRSTAKEALTSLTRVIPAAPLSEIERVTSRLALRVRPFFENEDPPVRKAAISLLADLFRCGYETSARPHLAEQVHTTIISLLLHLNESDPEVIRACKSALRQAGPLLDCPAINTMFQSHLPDDGRLNYSAFLTDLIKLMSVNFNESTLSTYLQMASSYFKSLSPELRSNAIFFVGLLAGNSKSLNTRSVCLNLGQLLHDPCKPVRLQAIEAISLMYG